MIHFFFTYTNDASDSPFVKALRALNVEHAVYSRRLDLNYRWRLKLLFVGLPALLRYSVESAVWSFLRSGKSPSVVVAGSHTQALILWIFRVVLRRQCRVVLLGFIYTQRSNRLLQFFRLCYFRWLFAHIDQVVCHSELEVSRYRQQFAVGPDRFVFVPYGLHVGNHEADPGFIPPGSSYALSAGRSGRDYKTLCAAFLELGTDLHIVCDAQSMLRGLTLSAGTQLLSQCYGADYFSELRGADLVVVPIGVTDISAGQMVVIQAMAVRKPVIVTRTPTLDHYVRDGWNALLVTPGDSKALAAAVRRLHQDPSLAKVLADRGYKTFVEFHSMPVFVANLVAAVSP